MTKKYRNISIIVREKLSFLNIPYNRARNLLKNKTIK